MKKLLLALACVSLLATAGYSQTASFSFTDNGLYNGTNTSGIFNPTDTFTLSLFGTISGMPTGFTGDGYSLWIEAPTGVSFNTTLNITGVTYFQFTDPTQPIYPKTFTSTSGADSGFNSDQQGTLSGDLGATSNGAQTLANGVNAHLADYTFSLAGAPAGTYTIFTTAISPKRSEISYDNGSSFLTALAPETAYTITISAVPEPETWSLLGLGSLSTVGMMMLRRRRA